MTSQDSEREVWRQAIQLYDQFQQLPAGSEADFDAVLRAQPAPVRAAFDSLKQAGQRADEESFLGKTPPSALDLGASAARVGGQLGPYQVESLIAEGGSGAVYRARRCSDYQQLVAIKVLSARFHHARGRTRFQAERQALADLVHPHICRLLDAGDTEDGAPYLVMELIDGGPIDQYCRSLDISLGDRVRWFADICRAVSFAHSQGILHRDLKPSNVLIDAAQQVRVTDFGLAKFLRDDEGDDGVTLTGEILGTPGYMAPEQAFRQLGEVSVSTDVYGLGGVLYALLVEGPPFRGDSKGALRAVAQEQSDDPTVMTEAATAWFRLAKIHGVLGNHQGRKEAAREALRRFQDLAQRFPERDDYRFDVFHCYFVLHAMEAAYRTIHQLVEETEDPRGEYREALITLATGLSRNCLHQDPVRAAALIAEGQRAHDSLRRDFADPPNYHLQWHRIAAARARLLLTQEDFIAAAESAEEAIALCRESANSRTAPTAWPNSSSLPTNWPRRRLGIRLMAPQPLRQQKSRCGCHVRRQIIIRNPRSNGSNWPSRCGTFFAAAARAMQHLLVDHVRRRKSQKRGGNFQRVPLDDLLAYYDANHVDVLALDEHLSELEAIDERKCQVVRLRFFIGMTLQEIADELNVSLRRVETDWQTARAFLRARWPM